MIYVRTYSSSIEIDIYIIVDPIVQFFTVFFGYISLEPYSFAQFLGLCPTCWLKLSYLLLKPACCVLRHVVVGPPPPPLPLSLYIPLSRKTAACIELACCLTKCANQPNAAVAMILHGDLRKKRDVRCCHTRKIIPKNDKTTEK